MNDKQVRDMTKSQLVKGAFRMLTEVRSSKHSTSSNKPHLRCYRFLCPYKRNGRRQRSQVCSVYNHLSQQEKEKDGTEVVGNLIKAKTHKSRLSKENKDVTVRLYYDERGLDRYYGLLELGEIGGLWKNVAGRYEIDGKKVYAKAILKDPEQYFTPEVMQKLDEIAKEEFSYGS